MKSVNVDTFDSEIESSEKPVLVSFISSTCKMSGLMQADLEELEKDFGQQLSVAQVDLDGNEDLADRFSVISTPTTIMFSQGKQVMQIIGYSTKHDLREKIEDKLKTIA